MLKKKKNGFCEWLKKKSVPLQIVTLSYGTKCLTLLIVDTVSDSLFLMTVTKLYRIVSELG